MPSSSPPVPATPRFTPPEVLSAERDLTIFANTMLTHAGLLVAELQNSPEQILQTERVKKVEALAGTLQNLLHEAVAQWRQENRADLPTLRSLCQVPLEQMKALMQHLSGETLHRSAEFTSDLARVRDAAERFELRLTSPRRSASPHMSSGALSLQETVLIVDDEPFCSGPMQRRLERAGYMALVANSGQNALEQLRSTKVDLILLDVVMPAMSGPQLLAQLKLDSVLRDIPVVMLSAMDDEVSLVRCIELGAEDYMIKPCDPVLLKARMSSSLEKKRLQDRAKESARQIAQDRAEIERLLHVILPPSIAAELRSAGRVKPRRYDDVAVLFTDVVNFTQWCETRAPEEVLPHLQQLVEIQEDIVGRFGLEKIKTIGDAFMAVGGLLQPLEDPVLVAVRAGLEMVRVAPTLPAGWQLRVGVHVGPVQAGVVGRSTYFFDIWGDTVNTAARVQAFGQPGAVVVSALAWDRISHHCEGMSLGMVTPKGLPPMELIRVDRA